MLKLVPIAGLFCFILLMADAKSVQEDEISNNSLDTVNNGNKENEEKLDKSGPPKNVSHLLDVHIHLPERSACFPADAFARTENNRKVSMKDLKIGDKVLTTDNYGNVKYSEVILMLHQDKEKSIDEYVRVQTERQTSITLSTHHLIKSNDKFIYAKDVRAGHILTAYDEHSSSYRNEKVISVELVTKKGLFAPLTMDGTIVVNDVLASCYASFPSQSVAHFGFSVWRVLYTYFNGFLDSRGESLLRNLVHLHKKFYSFYGNLFEILLF